jgi:hypothetical protein
LTPFLLFLDQLAIGWVFGEPYQSKEIVAPNVAYDAHAFQTSKCQDFGKLGNGQCMHQQHEQRDHSDYQEKVGLIYPV